MSALSAGNVHSTSKKHAQQQSALFPTQTLEESLQTETAGVKDIPSPMSRKAGLEDTSIMSNALNEMSLDSQITISNSVKTDEVPDGVQSMLSSVSLDRKSNCPLSPRTLEKREKARAQRALEKARKTAYLTEPPTPTTRPKSTTPSRTSSLLLPVGVSLSSDHREPPRVRLPYYLRQNNTRHQKTPLSKGRADGSEGSHPHLSYSTHPDGLDCLDVDYKDGLLEGVYLKDSDIRMPKGEKLISKSSGKGLLSLASFATAAPMQTFKAPVDKSQRLVFFSKYRNLFATPIPVKQSLPVPRVPPGDFWEKKIVSLEPPDSRREIVVDR